MGQEEIATEQSRDRKPGQRENVVETFARAEAARDQEGRSRLGTEGGKAISLGEAGKKGFAIAPEAEGKGSG